MLAVLRGYRNRYRIIQSSYVNSNAVGPSLEGQGKFRAAFVAEMDIDILTTAFRRERVDRGIIARKRERIALENRFNHPVRARGALTKATIADRNPKGIATGVVTYIAAETATGTTRRHASLLCRLFA